MDLFETGSSKGPPETGSGDKNSSSTTQSTPPPPSESSNNNNSSTTSTPTPPASPPPAPPASPPPAPPQSPPPSSPPPPKQDSPDSSSSSSPPPPNQSNPPPPPDQSHSPPPPSLPSQTQAPPSPPVADAKPSNGSSSVLHPPPPAKGTPAPPGKASPPSKSAHKSPSSSSSSHSSDQSSDPDVGFIVGIAVAGVILLAFIITCVACSRRRKKRRYYYEPSHRPNDQYYNVPMQNHAVPLPPGQGGPGGWAATPPLPGGAGAWATPPPPPPPGVLSSEFGGGYSTQQNSHMPPASPRMGGLGGFNQSQFSYEELATATGGFSQANLLGQGGFGYVHKGVLSDKREVAVKSLKSGSGQGEREFQAEVDIISRVHHRHLVSLVGYCITENQRMLVYEFVSNKTLEHHLYGTGQPPMEWAMRLQIALGSAKGLAYLHEDCHPRIIHRDIKAANILIDSNFEAMVADFGLAKLSTDNSTHISTRVMGTFGYMAPEYAQSGKLTEKSDVFSFGVMLLELITGRKPIDMNSDFEESLVDWARPRLTKALEDGNYIELADPRMEGNYEPHEMARMVASAAASIRHSARRRPKMSQIVRSLQGDSSLEELNEGVKTGQTSNLSSTGNVGYDTCAYNADMMKFRKMVMPSQEFASGEYGTTSEYGLNPSSSSSDIDSQLDSQSKTMTQTR